MKRLYTAFVSSTFIDLKEERQRLATTLLRQDCVPLGMEFFPSTGTSQWPIITESIAAADFCIFVVAGRYGTISDNGLSWTHREFREAVAHRKPIIGMLHNSPGTIAQEKSETTDEGRKGLARLRSEIEEHTICGYFETESELLVGVTTSIAALQLGGTIEGWVPAGRNPVVLQQSDFDRVYELFHSKWSFRRCPESPETWDASYWAHRRVRANNPDGVTSCAVDFTREVDNQLPFGSSRSPELRLVSYSRTRGGQVGLNAPRKRTGPAFVQDVVFNPALTEGEVVDFVLEGQFPAYKLAYREDLVVVTMNSRMGPRNYEWSSRSVTFPTDELRMEVFIPLDLQATPRGPLIGRSSQVDNELVAQALTSGAYTAEQVERDGTLGWEMQLRLVQPRLQRRYRLAWDLPTRPALTQSTVAEEPVA